MTNEELLRPFGQLKSLVRDVALTALRPMAAEVDRAAIWPAHAFRALAEAGLMGLHVPKHLGGWGEGLTALALVTEELGAACPSSAMCYGMHCVATKVIQVKATANHEDEYLRPIAEGRHITTLALSEPGTGSQFYMPQMTFTAVRDKFQLDGMKSFVTNGGQADSYVMSAVAPGPEQDPGTFSCFVVDASTPGLEWQGSWQGFGMRGNSSRAARMNKTLIPKGNLLGHEGDELWYVFDVIAPYFLVAMAGVYLGVARAALELTIAHLRRRRHAHTGANLAEIPAVSDDVAEMWIAVERARQLLRHAAQLGDAGAPDARPTIFACKVEIAETAVSVTNTAMTLAGGRAYEANADLARLLRDARAAHVMAPTTHMLKAWLGRSLLDLRPL